MIFVFVLLVTIHYVFVSARHHHDFTSDNENSLLDYEHYENLVSVFDTKLQMCCDGSVLQLNRSIYQHQRCCDGILYNDQTHGCCGKFAYELNNIMGCCKDKIYSKEASSCCSSVFGDHVLIRIPYDVIQKVSTAPNITCCGLQLYENSTHHCCPKRQFKYLPNHKDYSSGRKYYTAGEYNRHEEDILNGHITDEKKKYNKFIQHAHTYQVIAEIEHNSAQCHKQHNHKVETSKSDAKKFSEPFDDTKQIFGKCGMTSFNIFTQICCSVAKVSGIDTIYESKLHNRKSKIIQCCGLEIYDISMQICCNGNEIFPQTENVFSACCGSQIYDVTQQICCDWSNSLLNATSIPNTTDRCCGDSKTIYSPEKEICCGGTVMSNPNFNSSLSTSEECHGTASNDSCHSGRKTSADNYICCDDTIVIAKESINDTKCCGDRTYNSRIDMCCVKQDLNNPDMTEVQLYHGASSDKSCCGKAVYNTSHQGCCDGRIFDHNSELCCLVDTQRIVVQTKSKNDECCGTSSYDHKTERCCNGNVIDAPAKYFQCCGSVLHDPEDDLCCKGVLYQPRNKRRMKCCGIKMIDSVKQICCHGAVKDVVNPLKAACCYKAIS